MRRGAPSNDSGEDAAADPHRRAQGRALRRRRQRDAPTAPQQPRPPADKAARAPRCPLPRPAGDRRAALHQHERRAGAGIFLRRHQRRHHHRAVEAALVLRHRAQLVLHLQGQAGASCSRSPRNSACAMWSKAACARAATASASPRSSTTSPPAATSGPSATTATSPTCSPCRTRSPRTSSPRSSRKLYAAESFRAQRKPPDSLDAWDLVMRALSHYWRVTRQDNVVAQALLEKAIAIDPELRPGARRARDQLHVHRPYGLDRHGGGDADWPSGPRWRRSAPTARTPGRTMRSAMSICSRGASTIRWPSSKRRCGSIRISRWRRAITALSLSYSGRWQDADEAARRALRLSPRDPYSAVYTGIAAYAQFLGARLRGGDPARPRSAAPARRFCRRPPGADRRRRHGRAMRNSPAPPCRSCAGPSPTFRSPGSPSTCRSSWQPTASTISKVSGAPALI